MTDLATLALKIDSSEVKTGVDELNKLTAAGTKTEAAVDKMGEAAADTAAKTKTAAQAAAEMAREAQAAAAGGSAYAKAWATADAAISRLAQAQAEASQEIARAKAAYDAGESSLAEYNAELLRTKAALSLVEAEHQQAMGALRRHATAQAAANDSLTGFTKTSGGAAFAARNLNYQLVDMAQGFAMGAPPLMILMQQLPQAADAFNMLAKESGGAGNAIGSLAGRFGPVLVAAAAVAAAVALITEEVNKNSETTVTWQDVVLGAWDAYKEYLTNVVTKAFEAFGLSTENVWADIVKVTKWAINWMIGAMTLAPRAMITAFQVLPGAIADLFISAANLAVRALNGLMRAATDLVNGYIIKAQALLNVAGQLVPALANVKLPTLTAPQIGELANSYSGAAAKAGKAFVGTLTDTVGRDFLGEAGEFLSPYANSRRAQREAEEAGKSIGGRTGRAAGAQAAKSMADEFAKNLLTDIMATNNAMQKALEPLSKMFGAQAQAEWDAFIAKTQADKDKLTQPAVEAAEATAFWNEELSRTIGYLGQIGGFGGELANIAAVLQGISTGNYTALPGKAGALIGLLTQQAGGADLLDGIGRVLNRTFGKGGELENQFDQTFGNNGTFAQTMIGVLQGAATGSVIGGTIFAGNGGAQIGSMVGGALGQEFGKQAIGAISGSLLSSLGSAAGPLGAIAGSLIGGLIGGAFKQSKSKANVITNGDVSGTFGGTGGDYTRGADALSKAVLDNLDRLADAFGATATGAFKVSVGMRDGNYVYNPTGSGTKASMGAINVGKDSEAAIKGAIQDAISDGVFEGLSAGVERLLKGEGDLETQLQKALSFQGVFDELEQMKDPQGFDLKQLDKWRKGMDELFAEAGATADEIAQLEELTGLKRKEIVEKYSEEIANAEEIASQKRALEIQIMELTGDAAGALAATRAIERAAADASLHPLMDRIYALQDEATASAQAAQAAQEAAEAQRVAAERMMDLEARLAQARGDTAAVLLLERTRELAAAQSEAEKVMLRLIYATEDQTSAAAIAASAQQASQQAAADAAAKAAELLRQRTEMEAELLRLQGKEAEAVQLERQLRLQQIDPSLRALQQLIFAEQDLATARAAATKKVEDARSVLTEAYERESSALRDTIDKFKDLRDTLADFRSSLFTGQGFDSLAVLQGRFNKTSALANTGQEQALRDLPGVAREFLEAARGRASSLVDYQLQVASVARAVDQAMGAADDVVDYNELQLEALDKSVEGLLAVKEEVKSVREAVIELKAAIAEQTGTVQQIGTTQIRVQNETNRTLKNVTEGGYAIKTQAVA